MRAVRRLYARTTMRMIMTTRMSRRLTNEVKDTDRLGGVLWQLERGRPEESRQLVTNLITIEILVPSISDYNSSNYTAIMFLVTSAVRSWPVQRPFHGGPTSFDPFLKTSSFEPFLN